MEEARLDWARDDADLESPRSTTFDDLYFSRQSGRAESEHVFIAANDLPRRLAEWRESRPFVIGETGFGTGLNMLCAWASFDAHAPPGARLHLVSTEKHPLSRDDLARALRAWPDLAERAQRLVSQWPAPVAGVHRLWLDRRVTLDLHFGDSVERLARLEGRVDAWFLDGFAPSKNPEMWQPSLFEAMAAHSRAGATFATFTCAGIVKRGLKAAGFSWRKVPGFGRKREMLTGEIVTPPAGHSRRLTPWFCPPPALPVRHVAVIGAGLAGTTTAQALARRGLQVTLIDREAPGAGGSGNGQGALYVKLSADTNLQSRVYLAGLLHSRRWLAELDPTRRLWDDCGVMQLATSEREAKRQQRFADNHALPSEVVEHVAAETADARSGLPEALAPRMPALDYPSAGWVRPKAVCEQLSKLDGIHFHRADVVALERCTTGWTLTMADGHTLTADQVVIANAALANRFTQTAGLPLQPIRGQVSTLALSPGIAERLPAPKRVICAGGYLPPPLDGALTFGATFAPNDSDTALRDSDHTANLAELKRTLPGYAEALDQALRDTHRALSPAQLGGRAAVRAASPDKTPYAGPLPDAERWKRDYAVLARDARRVPATPGAHHAGLWISAAHGSRGLASAPLCAELLASRICDEPLPLERELVDHLHPGRRLISDIVRGTAG
ncbi:MULTISPECIES: bifunctional tRNA (5-methylaminomethyl-2-thiouridine)(34)-methyltransferase MnmD/FAD-dependent 5-carboxymethylaminomethyl-2-thiouridine(34) oxidoreductase MnmC [Halomonadaceae]|uniref:bifunctional tRNA (5-methylaminomethyl-2-thiouridine)(34)-methyltransferase MnmD/FAD-dependent 5-carboxymethylaminomethyl-2-thiouridine(34) oxidoreductase MnmC n=1 Tax=Halomonadaceae TaxID=28256 RepID=UPI001598C107|nr:MULTISPECIES: bifunctional tRNA (5-methylaminomethyl-2-thiouridine)(34)-methyltransferase MnmD/FAD-dependent 5-carboxymethylaminomethyl-2-thiouridine(34) oxidoreductase MnmC [Halomonas]QJQ97062.1 bifunctional tRNA (5-methylaminomethyl-2-thiouridine)(34)-methyltransferase MnmD/FAD-dependent 5-carboxymethylaminomethyl-2-thiouridine(34) oxidoreductase MnmC [Halomonas sp. PA5]